MIWHSESAAAVITQLQTDSERGLSADEAAARLRTAGENRPARPARQSLLRRFGGRLKSPAVVMLLAVALISLGVAIYRATTGHADANWWEPAVVLALALLRCLLSVLADNRAAGAMERLESLAAPTVRVWRDGTSMTVCAAELVAGDVVQVETGDLVSADCRLLSSAALRCDESPLTGDTMDVDKDALAVVPAIAPLRERVNMLYAGCAVLHGQGRAVVVETGANTEMGKSAAMQRGQQKSADTLPVQSSLIHMAKKGVPLVLAMAAVVLVLALVCDMAVLSALLLALATAVAVLPEETASLSSPALAAAVKRMAAQGAVVRHAEAVETMGRVSVICSDKTGSFTQNDMTLVRAFVGDHMVKLDDNPMPDDVNTLVQLTALCTGEGEATDAAIAAYALQHGMNRAELIAAYPRLGEIPFDSDRRRMTVVHLIEGRHVVIVKGAPEGLLPLCAGVPAEIADAEDFMEAGALRVLAVAYKYIDEAPTHCFADELEQGLTFLGLLGLSDPPRPDAVTAVADCRTAGIQPVMLTGDNLTTASAVARRLGLMESPDQAIAGDALAAMSDTELLETGTRLRVCARVDSADKTRVVSAWQKSGAAVALTGDGAADIPAMRQSDVSCAMQRGSADVTVAAADVVLTDDRFSTLVSAVRESRAMFWNLRRAVQYGISRHVGVVVLLAAALIGWGRTPLTPVGLLWMSLVAGVLPVWALTTEPAGRDAMRRAPRGRDEGLLTVRSALCAALGGLLLAVLALVALLLGDSTEQGMTMAFAVAAFGQLSWLLSWRTPLPLWQSPPWRGWRSFGAALCGAALLLPLWLVPGLRALCGLTALGAGEIGTVVWLSLVPFILGEIVKIGRALMRRRDA